MNENISLVELLDQAKSVVGSDYKIAQLLEIPRSHVSAWRHGKRTATPEDQALLAGLAGLDAAAWLARATCAKHEGTAKGDRLKKVLGKASLAPIGVSFSAGASAAQAFSLGGSNAWDWVLAACSTMYRSVKLITTKGSKVRLASVGL